MKSNQSGYFSTLKMIMGVPMKFSLIMATVGREKDIPVFLDSLNNQTYKNFELIVVDQNQDERVTRILNKYKDDFEIKHIKSEKGLSKARNVGLKHITGDIIAFPDDDCVYESHVLENVKYHLMSNKVDGVTGKHVDNFNEIVPEKFVKLNQCNVWFWSISFTVFVSKEVILKVGDFDILLGVGSGTKFGSGEETDYLIRAINKDFNIYHSSIVKVKHPFPDFNDQSLPQKAYNYSVGRRYVLDKHKYNYLFVLINVAYPILKLLLNLSSKTKVRFYWKQFLGRLKNAQ